ncbi:hypothetical protein CRG98_042011 [Punica granatum]|uniref:FLZ-type domain-containing protein n=1 Tax=Punica granatum TaxID=22663 RepID=A0A2I0I0U9_PUNGR|nr:hypothetical protein CRG98_042011 [Punica granatum]
MEMLLGKKRKPSLSLSLFTSFQRPLQAPKKSPKPSKSSRPVFFDPDVVGLAIIATMPHQELGPTNPAKKNIFLPPMLSETSKRRTREADPLSESYTCVITHLGNDTVRKRVYYDDQVFEVNDNAATDHGQSIFAIKKIVEELKHEIGIGPQSSAYFLGCCRLCKKQLHGMDIFMYSYLHDFKEITKGR